MQDSVNRHDSDAAGLEIYVLCLAVGALPPLSLFFGQRAFATSALPFIILFGFYPAAGAAFGYSFPALGWKWGGWLVLPSIMVIGAFIYLMDYNVNFVSRGLWIMALIILVPACLGAFIGSRLSSFGRRQKPDAKADGTTGDDV